MDTPNEKSYDERTFSEQLAMAANREKTSLVSATLQAFREGEPSAIKLVTQALLESQFSEDQQFPVSDDRFKQIINLAAEAISEGRI